MHRLRTRAADEEGVVLVLVALLLVVIIGCAALAIDVGSFYQAQRQAQSAADAGALAGSQDLPTDTTQALQDATTYALKNDSRSNPSSSIVTSSTGAIEVKVTVSASTPSFFGQIFGITHANVSATAVAGHNFSPVPASIFADAGSNATGPSPTNPANCSEGITFTGNSGNNTPPKVEGLVSNGKLVVTSNSNAVFPYESSGAGCTSPAPPAGAVVNPPQDFPIDYRLQYPNGLTPYCNGSQTPPFGLTVVNLSGSQGLGQLASNTLYCDPSGTLDLTGNNSKCVATNVMFYVQALKIDGNNCDIEAPTTSNVCGLLVWATDTNAADQGIVENANGTTTFCGTMFAPQSTITLAGNNSGSGFVEGENVSVPANQWSVTATGPAVGSNSNSLVQ